MARGYDPYSGRFSGIDPVSNYMLSGYAGMVNNPMSYIDPDGRNPIAIGAFVAIFANTAIKMAQKKEITNMWDFLKPGIAGAAGGAFQMFAPNPLTSSIWETIRYGAFAGAATGGINDIVSGGNGRGALIGGISGGLFAGANWGFTEFAFQRGLHNINTASAQIGDPIYSGGSLPEVVVKGKSVATLARDSMLRQTAMLGFAATSYIPENNQTWPPYNYTGAVDFSYPEAMFMPIPKIGVVGGNSIRMANVRTLGAAGEKAAGITGTKVGVRINGRMRFPDELNFGTRTLTEVKNVRHLNFTRQLRDYYEFSQARGLRMKLYTRETTTFSGPLQRYLDEGLIIHKTF